jgi:1-acyl-sn-glycerol-3-phosphate acyltransferase
MIFPEGTRSPAGQVGELRPGFSVVAERSRLPVIPVLTDSGRFWGRDTRQRPPGTIRVTVLPALPAGLTRAQTIARLQALYEQRPPVENSVGGAGDSLSRRSRHTE